MPKADPKEVEDMFDSLGDWVDAISEVDKVLEDEAKEENEVRCRASPGSTTPPRHSPSVAAVWLSATGTL